MLNRWFVVDVPRTLLDVAVTYAESHHWRLIMPISRRSLRHSAKDKNRREGKAMSSRRQTLIQLMQATSAWEASQGPNP